MQSQLIIYTYLNIKNFAMKSIVLNQVKIVITLTPLFIYIVGLGCFEDIERISYNKADEDLSVFLAFFVQKFIVYTLAALVAFSSIS